MNNFRSDSRSREKRSSYKRIPGRRDSGRREMFDVVCDNCGKNTQVPFKPSGDKPVYCNECFEKKGGRSGGRQDNKSSQGRDMQNRRMVESPRNTVNDQSIEKLAKSIETLSSKLDSIITLLSSVKKEEAPVAATKVKKDVKTVKKEEKAKTPKAKTTKKEKAVKTKAGKAKLLTATQ